ncbi:hypothetical protein FA13DRAFT_1031164 [Coprinellus micaceus]|uniref:Uncharacterized protein n=1 Tax=Coprinellus micaceus TaxID=71717 RepID=A0A4Y7SZK6_COPMI|nr:hypothetical protein FA13DRAFT_1031164 [Coprinellus micaceus]
MLSFHPKNHTVTRPSFENTCTPLGYDGTRVQIDSGFLPVFSPDSPRLWNYTVLTEDPVYFYCAQTSLVKYIAKHRSLTGQSDNMSPLTYPVQPLHQRDGVCDQRCRRERHHPLGGFIGED